MTRLWHKLSSNALLRIAARWSKVRSLHCIIFKLANRTYYVFHEFCISFKEGFVKPCLSFLHPMIFHMQIRIAIFAECRFGCVCTCEEGFAQFKRWVRTEAYTAPSLRHAVNLLMLYSSFLGMVHFFCATLLPTGIDVLFWSSHEN